MKKKIVLVMLLSALAVVSCKGRPADNKAAVKSSAVSPVSKPAAMPPPYQPAFAGDKLEARVKNIVLRYNELLVFGYENLNMNFLQEVATPEQAEKAYFHMAAIGEGRVRMRSHLKKIDWARIDVSTPGKAVVQTNEVWDFAYHDIKTDKKGQEEKDFVYHITYTIAREKDGRWLISDIAATSDEKGKPAPKPRQ